MPVKLRQWSIYVSGIALFLAVGFGVPLLLLEGVASVFTGLPPTLAG